MIESWHIKLALKMIAEGVNPNALVEIQNLILNGREGE